MNRDHRRAEREWVEHMIERNERAARLRHRRRSTEKRESTFVRLALSAARNPDSAAIAIVTAIGWIVILTILITESL